MDQQSIRFTSVDGRPVAYASSGEGPPLLIGGWWMSHLELDWRQPQLRAFVQALGRHRTVYRYDRCGTGLSDHGTPPAATMEEEVRILEGVSRAIGDEPTDMFAISSGAPVVAAFAAEHPDRVRNLVLYGGYANGAEVAPPQVRSQLIELVRTSWGLGSRVLSDLFLPTASGEDRAAFSAYQREAASGELAARSLEIVYAVDATDHLAQVAAPTTVIHRREDRAIPFALGRKLAAGIPGAEFIALEGVDHLPWRGASSELANVVLGSLGVEGAAVELEEDPGPVPEANPADTDLSPRELEVLRLVAVGLNDREIAEELVLSPHTVHRHVANVRNKLRLPSRAAAAAQAARLGLI